MVRDLVLGVDVGGTFTDVCLVDMESGAIWTTKVSTTPDNLTVGSVAAINRILEIAQSGATEVTRLLLGSTAATNAILESTGAECALVTTKGFRYVMEIGRHDVPRKANVYTWEKPARPVPPRRIVEVAERISASGDVVVSLRQSEIDTVVEQVERLGVAAVAICLLHSYTNPVHERSLAITIKERLPKVAVTISSDVLPVYREFERSMAVALNAYILPVMTRYVEDGEKKFAELGISVPPLYMQSNGGVIAGTTAVSEPIRLVLSGPAAGVSAAAAIGQRSGFENVISIDIGGTSADIGIVRRGEVRTTTQGRIGPWPIPIPMTDIETVGAGGGSIASVTPAGSLVVGPQSAGARPGPAAYGLGGEEPTVTDANLILGYLGASLIGGDLSISLPLAQRAVERFVGSRLDMGVIEASFGILSIVNENMVAAIRRASVERGLDPRDFALMALGGAGGLHVCRLAELLGTETVIVPQHSGVLSALGLVTTDLKNQFAQTMPQREGEFDVAAMETVYERLESAARVWFEEERIEPADQTVVRLADLRYANQGFELSVAMHEGVATEASLERLISRFHERHKELYTFNAIGAAVEIVTLRVEALGRRRALPSPRTASRGTEGSKDYVVGERLVHFDLSGPLQTRIIDREQLHPGWTAPGPLLIAEKFTTTLVPATWRCTVGDQGDLILKG